MDLQHPERKMSKSLGGGVLLADDEATITAHLKKAVTSNEPRVIREAMKAASEGVKGQDREWKGDENLKKQYAGLRNLFTIMMAVADEPTIAHWQSVAESGELQFSEFKPALASLLANHFAAFRARRAELLQDPNYVDEVIADGARRANEVANATLLEMQKKMGLR
jgi:tryptophanyl-tRNA synthetase